MMHRMKPEDILSALEVAQTIERRRALETAAVLERRTLQKSHSRASLPRFTPRRAK